MTNIHNLEIFTVDDAESGPDSILMLQGFEGNQDIQAFLAKLFEPEQPEDDVIWPANIVVSFAGFCETTIRRKVHKGEFPAPLDLGDRRKGWVASEVIAWRKGRPRRWIGEIRKPVALRKNWPNPSNRRSANATTQTKGNAETGATAAA